MALGSDMKRRTTKDARLTPQGSDTNATRRAEGQLLQAMLGHWIHEDNLYWTQIRHLLVLQLAVSAAWFGVGTTVLAALIMFGAALVSIFLFRLATKIQENRDVNLDAIAILSNTLASDGIREEISRARQDDAPSWGLFRFARHPLGTARDEGKRFHVGLFFACIALNLALGFVSIHDVVSENAWLRHIHPRFERTTDLPNFSVQRTPTGGRR